MSSTAIAVWEPTPYWVPELQRVLVDQDVRIDGCHSVLETSRLVDQGLTHLVVAPGADERMPLASLGNWIQRGVGVHVILTPAQSCFRWFLHEQGAASVFDFAQARDHLGPRIRHSILGLAPIRSHFR